MIGRAQELEVDTSISACPWSERPLSEAGATAEQPLEVMDLFELVAQSAGIEVGGHTHAPARRGPAMSVAFKSASTTRSSTSCARSSATTTASLPNLSSRINRTRVPAPFPVHRWADHMPDVAVLPRTAQEVSEVVKLANRLRIPVVPRAGGTGLADGAVRCAAASSSTSS